MTLRTAVRSTQFRKDVKLAQKRGKDMTKLRELILLLLESRPLPPQYNDDPLQGRWRQYRDCHIAPDWVLIYKIEGDNLHLVRTGTHADLF